MDSAALMAIVGSAESVSSHPIGLALVHHAKTFPKNELVEPEDVVEDTNQGGGIACKVYGKDVPVGNYGFMKGKMMPYTVEEAAEDMEKEGKSVVYVCVDGRVVAGIGLADTVRR